MKPILIKTDPVEFTPILVSISAKVRYWEDATVNGEEDSDQKHLIPLRKTDVWKPSIFLVTGNVWDWPRGTTAEIHYKVCDAGEYWLEDAHGRLAKYEDYYVPDFLAVGKSGHGDYIIMNINAEGFIEGWKEPELDGEDWKMVKS